MTPEQHAKAIEDAAEQYAYAYSIDDFKDRSKAFDVLQDAIWAGVSADHSVDANKKVAEAVSDSDLPTYTDDLELRYADACEERDHLRQLVAREGWQLVPVEPTNAMLDAMEESGWTEGNYRAVLAAAPKP